MKVEALCVFCGSSKNVAKKYLNAASLMGEVLAKNKIRLIFGGSNTGLMGAVSRGVLKFGGEAVGIIPEFFYSEEGIDKNLTNVEIVADMHTRKSRMAELADGFIALPGGFGTLEELFEAITWGQIGLQSKPVGILNTDGFYDTLIKFIDELKENGFIYAQHRKIIQIERDVNQLVKNIKSYQPPAKHTKWII
jgi:uncharacterized protein (TIGR00730 family)